MKYVYKVEYKFTDTSARQRWGFDRSFCDLEDAVRYCKQEQAIYTANQHRIRLKGKTIYKTKIASTKNEDIFSS